MHLLLSHGDTVNSNDVSVFADFVNNRRFTECHPANEIEFILRHPAPGGALQLLHI